jgi:hypothetical protein
MDVDGVEVFRETGWVEKGDGWVDVLEETEFLREMSYYRTFLRSIFAY